MPIWNKKEKAVVPPPTPEEESATQDYFVRDRDVYKKQAEALQKEVGNLQYSKEFWKNEADGYRSQLRDLKVEVQRYRDQNETLQKDTLEGVDCPKVIDKHRQLNEALKKDVDRYQNQIQSYSEDNERLMADITHLKSMADVRRNEIFMRAERLAEVEAENVAVKQQVAGFQRENDALKEQLATTKQEYDMVAARLRQLGFGSREVIGVLIEYVRRAEDVIGEARRHSSVTRMLEQRAAWLSAIERYDAHLRQDGALIAALDAEHQGG